MGVFWHIGRSDFAEVDRGNRLVESDKSGVEAPTPTCLWILVDVEIAEESETTPPRHPAEFWTLRPTRQNIFMPEIRVAYQKVPEGQN